MKNKKLVFIPLILMIALLLMSCSLTDALSSLINKSTTVTEEPVVEQLPTEAVVDSNVVFADDFSDPNSGWDDWSDSGDSSSYVNGTYQLNVNSTSSEIWGTLDKNFTDTSVEVDATKLGGPDDNDFGIICRYTDSDNYYFAEIASDGYYAIAKYVDGTFSNIGSEGMIATDLVNMGDATNHLRFDCDGSTLSLYANGTLLTSVSDTDLTSGKIGLVAGSFDTGGVLISFDDVVVSIP
jgi:hypothetical protein